MLRRRRGWGVKVFGIVHQASGAVIIVFFHVVIELESFVPLAIIRLESEFGSKSWK